MKRFLLLASLSALLWQCGKECTENGSADTGLITSIAASLDAGQTSSKIGITVTPELDAYTWKEDDKIMLFEIESGEFTGNQVIMELTEGAGSRIANFATILNGSGIVAGKDYMALHAGSMSDITPPCAGGALRFGMPQTIDMFSNAHEDVEDNLILWTTVSVSDEESPSIDFKASMNDHTSIMEFHVRKDTGATFVFPHNLLSLSASTISGAHFVQSGAVNASGEFTIESYCDNITVNLLNQHNITNEPIIVRALVWWDQSVTNSVFKFKATTEEGKYFITNDIPKNTPIGAGKTVRPIPVVIDEEPQSSSVKWNGIAITQPAIYDLESKTATITSGSELAWIAQQVNSTPTNSFLGWTIKLGGDIDLGGKAWIPIGLTDKKRPFSGTFDGQGYSIYNISINTTTPYQALFGYCRDAEIKNLTIGSGSIRGASNIAGICAYAYDTNISYCRNRATINGRSYVGGITGVAFQSANAVISIKHCVNNGNITGTQYTNGIAGSVSDNKIIANCTNRGLVNGK